MCELPPDTADHDLDVSLMTVLSCHVTDAKAYAECQAKKAAIERAIKECAK